MYSTKHDLSHATRETIASLLQSELYDALELKLRAKEAHWLVRGSHFAQLHELFDKLAADFDGYADDLAERSVQLGFPVRGKATDIAGHIRLPEFAPAFYAGDRLILALVDSVAAFAKSTRLAIDTAAAAGDAGTSDLFTGLSRDVDKWLWMLEAHAH